MDYSNKKLAIIGSRNAPYIEMEKFITGTPAAVISGGARGVDSYAAAYARRAGVELVEFKPDYKRYGRVAPLKRNEQIIAACDCVLAFWDGVSRGTAYTIREAERAGKAVTVIHI